MTDIATTASPARSIVFIDSRVQDAATLLQGLEPGTEVVFLQAGQDGLAQMAAALGERGDVAAVQVIAHGSAGQLWLGNRFLDNAALQQPEVQALLAVLGRGLTADGDLLVYACNTAEGSAGAQFVSTLAALTGADVAASDDRTGAQGDWELEITTGVIAGPMALAPDALAAYDKALATFTVTNLLDSGAGSLRQAITDANTAPGADIIQFAPLPSGSSIFLSTGQLSISSDLQIKGDIDGNGTPDITINGNAAGRVLNITSGTVVLDGLTITNGKLTGTDGASGANALGAGISVTGAGTQVTILHSSITGNKATGGNGAYSYAYSTGGNGGTAAGGLSIGTGATVLMAATSVTGNSGTGGNGGYGYNRGGNGGNGTGGALVDSGGTFRYESGTVNILGNTGAGGTGGPPSPFGFTAIWGAAGASTPNISGSADNSWVYDLPPSITGAAVPANATYKAGDNLDFTVTYNEAVTVNMGGGTPTIALTLDTGGTVQAAYIGGSTTNTLTFRYTVAAGNLDANGIAAANSISLNGGTIQDSGNNNAPTTGIPFTSTTGVLVDAVAPSVSSINRVGVATTNASSVDYTVTFSETVTGVNASDFTLISAGASGSIAAVSGSGSTYTVTVSGITGDGTLRLDLNNVGTGIADVAGNAITGGYTSGQTYTIDNTAPAAPSTPVLVSASDSGVSNTDNITNHTTPTFTGTAEAGATVTLYADGVTALGSAVATGGIWSINSSLLSQGTRTVTAKATDAAGNVSGASMGLSVTIDTAAPTLTITSNVSTLKIGETATITFAFSEDPGASFSWNGSTGDVVVSGGTLSAISGTGLIRTATFTPTANTNDGTASITVASGAYIDTAGNNGGAGVTPALTFDTLPPAVPSAPDLATASDTGVSNTDNITSNTTPTFTGTAVAGSTVSLYDTDGSTLLGTATANGSGNWSITSSALLPGAHTLTATATDAAGNVSSASAGLTVTIVTASPPTISNLNGDSVAWAGVGNTVTLDAGGNAALADADLGALNSGNGNWAGASLTVQRVGTAVSADVLGFNTAGASFTVSGNNLQSAGLTVMTLVVHPG